ncbi:hypothetical protein N7478_008035 [Penicillium angulare]|uniref:uncharacterized protein n=1 Tax=Penicillium angulare TaxID=116970 RepID=UPI0025406DDB|nr:uncharacterized protein N7478_008035 [Penicillium angulare]KAJ5272910.1 hypothetical protein N7478_008035 [Penicillium angulare]
MGGTPIHFGAIQENWTAFQRMSELYDENELLRPDNDAWSPLFWALLNRSAPVEIVRHLIDHGEDI